MLIVQVLILAAILGAATFIVLRQRRLIDELQGKEQRLTEWIDALKRERPTLVKMAQHIEEDETHQLIRNRYNLMAKLLAAGVSGDASRNGEILDEVEALVADRDDFMRQTRLIYERLQPDMTTRLRDCGLTDREVEVCCLYALGLNGKTIQQYTRDGRHFQNVGIIRKKLGLNEHDKNIDGFIRSLLR